MQLGHQSAEVLVEIESEPKRVYFFILLYGRRHFEWKHWKILRLEGNILFVFFLFVLFFEK